MPLAIEPEVPYTAFSGANITAVIGNRKVGTLQGLTYSITREFAGLWAMGSPDVRAFASGKRAIAGSLVFSTFDRHALIYGPFDGAYNQKFNDPNLQFSSRALEQDLASNLLQGARIPTRDFSRGGEFADNIATQFGGSGINNELVSDLQDIYEMLGNRRLRYADQIPEFDITLSFVNEQGRASFMEILGVRLINEGGGFSLDDMTMETAHTYAAKAMTPLTSLTDPRFRQRVQNAQLR